MNAVQAEQTNAVQIGQTGYEMPPREGFTVAHFLTVADIERSAHYYEKVFGARILSLGDGNAPGTFEIRGCGKGRRVAFNWVSARGLTTIFGRVRKLLPRVKTT